MSLEQHECGSHVIRPQRVIGIPGLASNCGRIACGWRIVVRMARGRDELSRVHNDEAAGPAHRSRRSLPDRNRTSRDGPEWKPHNGYSAKFSNIWSGRGNITSIFLIPDCGARAERCPSPARGTERVWPAPADRSRSPLLAMTAGQWRPAGTSDAVVSGSLILSGGGNAGEAVDVVAERTGPHAPVKLSGPIPPLAEAFHQRPETGLDLTPFARIGCSLPGFGGARG
jgi:hypothetical protein